MLQWFEIAITVAVMAPLLACVERLNPEVAYALSERRTSLAYLAMQLVWLPVVGLILVRLVDLSGSRVPVPVNSWAYAVQAIVAFVCAEVGYYWTHRAQHTASLLWRIHSIHHTSRQVNWLTTFRFHPLDVLVQHVPVPIAIVALGLPLTSLAPYVVAATVVTLFAHSNVATESLWLRRVVVTPAYHRSHHERSRAGVNFALTLPVVDVIFGTASFEVGTRHFGAAAEIPLRGLWRQTLWGLGLAQENKAHRE